MVNNISAAEQMKLDRAEMEIARSGKGQYTKEGSAMHYKNKLSEYMDSIERKYGTLVAYFICVGHEDKYRDRLGDKTNVTIEEDAVKMEWYKNLSKFYKNKLDGNINEFIVGEDRAKVIDAPHKVKVLMQSEVGKISPDKLTLELNEIVNIYKQK